jgi:hypothetical protein
MNLTPFRPQYLLQSLPELLRVRIDSSIPFDAHRFVAKLKGILAWRENDDSK